MIYRTYFLALTVSVSAAHVACAQSAAVPLIERHLTEGRLEPGEKALASHLEEHPDDAPAQFGLGIVRVLQAAENLAQNLYRYGLRTNSPRLPFVRLPVPQNSTPEPLTYAKWRDVLQQFVDDLGRAADTLAKVDDPDVKLTIPVGMIRLDLNGDGKAAEDETFWKVFTSVAWRAAKLSPEQQRFPIGFDAADVHWMIGYTHLLRAMAEAWLAHDTEDFYDQTAHIFFAGAQSPSAALGTGGDRRGFDYDQIVDLVAAIHLMRFEPAEPERMSGAREHLLSMIAQSRQCWKHALAESDDDREWIPNANQTSLTPLTVNEERIAAWKVFLDEAEAVLAGRKLLPHWRVPDERGINLKKVFEQPRTFDLVMWVHGAAAIPYLEQGQLVTSETAETLSRTFQGRFVIFAVWFQ